MAENTLSKNYPDRMILEHISLHDSTVKVYENHREEGMWIEIERFEGGLWQTPQAASKLFSPANDLDRQNVGWICVFHGVKDGWW